MKNKWASYGKWRKSVYPTLDFELIKRFLTDRLFLKGELKIISVGCCNGKITSIEFRLNGERNKIVVRGGES